MERAGTRAGDGFSKSFENSFDDRLSIIGSKFSNALSERGKLAGRRFSSDFRDVVTTRFRSTQREIAAILSDKDSFRRYAEGFSDVGEAVDRLNNDLERMNREWVRTENAQGKVTRRLVLTKVEMRQFQKAAAVLGDELETITARERALAREQEDLDASFRRLVRTVGDTDVFRTYSLQVGHVGKGVGDTREAFVRLRTEIEQTGEALGMSRGDIEEYVDRLDRTRITVDRLNEKMVEANKKPHLITRAYQAMGRRVQNTWRRMDSTVRAVLLLIAAAADQIAVLGSAVGAGLIGAGGAAATGILGVAGFASVVAELNKDLKDLPPDLRAGKVALEGFQSSFSSLRTEITRGALSGMVSGFESLQGTLSALTPSARRFGNMIGSVFDSFASGLKPGTAAFEELEQLIDNAADDFPALGSAVGKWGTALLRAFNRANPLAEQFVGWIDTLGERFDAFTRSNGFDQWVGNAMRVWSSFGRLLDSVGRTLNNLSSPAAVERTIALLDNLSRFVPVLGQILDVAGRLDPLGLIAQALADIGDAIAPSLPALGDLAEVLGNSLSNAISGFAGVLAAAAPAMTIAFEALAILIDSVPPGVLVAIGGGIAAINLAISGMAIARGITTAVTAMAGYVRGARTMIAVTDGIVGAQGRLSGAVGALGKLGLIGAAIGVAVTALTQLQKAVGNYNDNARQAAAGSDDLARVLSGTLSDAAGNFFGEVTQGTYEFISTTEGAQDALKQLVNVQQSGSFSRWISDMAKTNEESRALALALNNLDGQISQLPLEAAQEKFSAWADSVGATQPQILAMLNEMPNFKSQLEAAAATTGGLANNQQLVALALGETLGPMGENAAGLGELSTGADTAKTKIDGLADAIRGFSSETLTAREAERQFEAAVDALTASVDENGTSLDINTAKGRANEAALDAVAKAALDSAAATYERTGSEEAAKTAVDKGRDSLIKSLGTLGIVGAEAEAYADKLGLIPDDIDTYVEVKGTKAAENAINNVVRDRTVNVQIRVNERAAGIGGRTAMASGGILTGPTHVLAGEAGREAFVPLDRPLSMVDPSVRALAAFAQGIEQPQSMARGGIAGGGIVVEAGAIQISAPDPWKAALETVNRITEMAVS